MGILLDRRNHPAPLLRMARKSCSFPAYRLAVATRPSQPVGVSLSGQPGMQNAFPKATVEWAGVEACPSDVISR
jgi:hypothetical protein